MAATHSLRSIVRKLPTFAILVIAVLIGSSLTYPKVSSASYVSSCPESECVLVTAAYISHYTGLDCSGNESYYRPYDNYAYAQRSWNGTGFAGTTVQTITNYSWRGSDGQCHNDWPQGNTLYGFVRIYRDAQTVPAQSAYISHYTGQWCTGQESYYTPYDNYGYQARSWNGTGYAGTIRYTATNRSYRNWNGTCYNAWPNGNQLSGFVKIYR